MRKVFRRCSGVALAATLLAAPAAHARDWPETAGWTIIEGDDYCAMQLEYEGKGETVLAVGRNLDNSVLLIVANYSWSAKKDAEYALDFFLGTSAYGGGTSHGTQLGIRKGFATRFEPDFWAAFKAAPSLRIEMGETLVDQLRLSGSAAAAGVVDRCVAYVRGLRATEERERKRFAHIPEDPFANAKQTPAPPRAPPLAFSWVTNDDYPATALRAGEEGTVTVKLDIAPEGRVRSCTVTSSSGSTTLDTATCTLLQRRARFTLATNEAGAAVAGAIEHKVHWVLPRP